MVKALFYFPVVQNIKVLLFQAEEKVRVFILSLMVWFLRVLGKMVK
jgi:hypothetical protein